MNNPPGAKKREYSTFLCPTPICRDRVLSFRFGLRRNSGGLRILKFSGLRLENFEGTFLCRVCAVLPVYQGNMLYFALEFVVECSDYNHV